MSPRSPDPSTWPSSMRSSPNTSATWRRSRAVSRRVPSSSPTTSCGAGGSRAPGRSRRTTRTPRRCAPSIRRSSPILASVRRSCRSATVCSSPRGSADGPDRRGDPHPGPAVRDPARAGRHPRGAHRAARWGRRRVGLDRARDALPGAGGGRARRSASRATATTPTPTTALADGDEVAMIPPVSGGAGHRILELRERPFDASILADLADALSVPEDGAVVGFLGRTRSTPGRRRRARRPRPRATPVGASNRSNTRRSNRWPRRSSARSPTRSRRASASTGWRSSTGPATCRSARRRSRSSRSRRTGTRPSTRPATRSTRRRRGHPSGRPSASPTVTCGSATRREPDRRRTR